jgi:hypothetical protein
VVGGLRAGLAASRAPRVGAGDAAWALDRLGRLGERGLAAATLPAGTLAEAPATPAVPRLRPPGGLTLAVAGLLLATLAFVAPETAPAPGTGEAQGPAQDAGGAGEDIAPAGERPGPAPEAAGDARPTPADALPTEPGGPDAADPRTPMERLRDALNLPAEGPLDLSDLVERLADPELRRRAAEALAGHPVARVLTEGDNPPSVAAAALLDEQVREAEAAERARRAAAARALRAGTEEVPTDRRPLVARYLDRLAH